MLVDYRLDERIHGIELIQQIWASIEKNIPAALVTADKQDELRQQCREQGIGFLGKPVKPAALRAWLNRQKARAMG